MSIATLLHPGYSQDSDSWMKWRLTYRGGQDFINYYLEKLSTRESDDDLTARKRISYCPAFAAAAVDEVKDAIFQRTTDITRAGGTGTYLDCVSGANGGVDLVGSSMNSFIGRKILPSLLIMGRLGVFVDMPIIDKEISRAESKNKRPYLYCYEVEDILNWTLDEKNNNYNEYASLLVKERYILNDEVFGLPSSEEVRYRYFWLVGDGTVGMQLFDHESNKVDEQFLNIPKIPFVNLELSHSLLTNVANYQIGLLNLASSDISYCMKANFPFYTEQFDPLADPMYLKQQSQAKDGTAASSNTAQAQEIKVGIVTGRRYPKNHERPGFINPSAEPLKASMEKQEQMKAEIRELVKLAVQNLKPKQQSADSKRLDMQSLESGLSYIGLELENAEKKIAEYWSLYENAKPADIKYPKKYSLKTDSDRREDSKTLLELRGAVPSKAYQRAISKQVAEITVGHKVSNEELEQIYSEIENSEAIEFDHETIAVDMENGLVGPELASKIRGYPEGEWVKAQEARKQHLFEVAQAQSQASAEVRGATQTSETAKGEKKLVESGQSTGATEGNKMGGTDDKS